MTDASEDELLGWLEAQLGGTGPVVDVLERAPRLSEDDAYRMRAAIVQRLVARGDRHIGYKVAGSSKVIQKDEHVEGPMVGVLLQSYVHPEGEPISVGAYTRAFVEPEVAVLMKDDLAGPGATLHDVYGAVEGVFPAIEVVGLRGNAKLSHQARIIGSKFTGCIVLGERMSRLHGIDLRLEGMVESLNGVVQGSATGVEVLGNPLNAVALVANRMAEYGETLRAGMIVMTGSFRANLDVRPGDWLDVAFTRLGSVRARFVA